MTKLLKKLFIKQDGGDSCENNRTAYGNLSGFVGIACNALLVTIKLIAGLISGSISILSDAFNNLSDMTSSVVTMIGFKIASKPADEKHPFGHGRMEYMSGFIVSALIIVVGFELLKSSVEGIFNPADVAFEPAVLIILVISVLIKLWMYLFNRRLSRDIGSSAIAATAQDSLNDSVATTAVLVCALISKYTSVNIDPYAGLAVSGFIIYSGFKFSAEMLNPLLGEPPTQEFVDRLKEHVMKNDMFCGIHDLIVHNYGPGRCFASVHVEVPCDVDIIKCHEIIDECERTAHEEMGITLVIHMDPVDTGEEAQRILAAVKKAVREICPELSVHDFRIVPGENRTNLIFDVVVPFSVKKSPDELLAEIQLRVSQIDDTYFCVIQFDRSFNN